MSYFYTNNTKEDNIFQSWSKKTILDVKEILFVIYFRKGLQRQSVIAAQHNSWLILHIGLNVWRATYALMINTFEMFPITKYCSAVANTRISLTNLWWLGDFRRQRLCIHKLWTCEFVFNAKNWTCSAFGLIAFTVGRTLSGATAPAKLDNATPANNVLLVLLLASLLQTLINIETHKSEKTHKLLWPKWGPK